MTAANNAAAKDLTRNPDACMERLRNEGTMPRRAARDYDDAGRRNGRIG